MSDSALPSNASISSTSPPLVGKRVTLRPTSPRDYDYLFELSTGQDAATLWRYRGATPAPEQFTQSLWQDVLASFTIVRSKSQVPVGLVYAYRADFRNGFTHMALIVEDVPDRPILAHDGVLLFVNYVFTCWPFRKIYGETSERNWQRFQNGSTMAFVEEGRLKEHEYFGGRYWDSLFLALYRHQYEERARRILPRILASPAGPASEESR